MPRYRPLTATILATAVVAAPVLVLPTVAAPTVAAPTPPEAEVLISELANGGPGGSNDSFIELANFGADPVDLNGWRIYHCGASGSRGGSPLVPPLSGVTLDPGQTFVIAHRNSTIADLADATFSTALADDAFGAWLEDGDATLIDRIAVSPASRDSICGPPVPSNLDYHRGQSYQRTTVTGDVTADFIRAGRTPQAPNVDSTDPGVQPGGVAFTEIAGGGPGGDADEFVELANLGDDEVDVSGWRLYVCTPLGARNSDGLLATIPGGTMLRPGDPLVVAHQSVDVPDGVATLTYDDARLAEEGFGVLLEDAEGVVTDAVGIYETDAVYEPANDSPCTQGEALPNRLDYGSDHTYQRTGRTGDNAADFVISTRTPGDAEAGPEAEPPAESRETPVRLSEFAHGGPGGDTDQFVELANHGAEPVAMDGWTIDQCLPNGRRALTPLLEIGTAILDPGETFLAVLDGSALYDEGGYDAVYGTALDPDGYGLIVRDGQDRVVDRAGAYFATYSPCTDGVSLINFLETAKGDSFQRHQDTTDNVKDFVPADRTPGELAEGLRAPHDIPAEDLEPVDVAPDARPEAPALLAPEPGSDAPGNEVDLSALAGHTAGESVDVSFRGGARLAVVENAANVFSGVSDEAPPAARRLPGESRMPGAALLRGDVVDPIVSEATEGFPYQRFEVVVRGSVPDTFDVAWSGSSTSANELQLYVWNHAESGWELLDAAAGRDGGDITLTGTVDASSAARGRVINVLVQDGPATRPAFGDDGAEPDHAFADPGEYDFALGMLPDPQELTQHYRDVHADKIQWLVQNQDARKIAYTAHVGDIVQNWMWGTHMEGRGRDEFQFASDIMAVLEDAGHPYGILPGNHDNKWGRDSALYNEYFPPSRFEEFPWYGESWRPGDNASHYDEFEVQGAKFLVVNIGYVHYFDRDEVLGWAHDVIAAHPEHNVIVSAHEYLNRAGVPTNPENDRWTSLGERIWDEVVRPNENVFFVMAGHVVGVAYAVKHDVDGVEGRMVTEMLANYQGYAKDGERNTGFLRLLQIDIDSKTMAVNTYSPTLDQHNAGEYWPQGGYTDGDDEFIVPFAMNDVYAKRVSTSAFGLASVGREPIATVRSAAGETATATWSGLESGTRYLWFADAEDTAGRSARSGLGGFTS
ncbi:hypothetical protein G1H11_23135 [Phytoactinopolyspora alkaliphila]|uniref:LTD domain-containing protein n=1 Tax=Phytoactinopolyspora alkaliphila TaxID=1783498 RepID=A0A6N9YTQ8_9ACTN|nr:lamin tail domain-containing protein [Phytoactinopolyspora alkaliphila]NED98199.1 hypothetical protein [Phytoactinopolyspora alkaliphila]